MARSRAEECEERLSSKKCEDSLRSQEREEEVDGKAADIISLFGSSDEEDFEDALKKTVSLRS